MADKATAPGYTFDGWKKDNAEVTSFTMPAGAVQLTGRFTANTAVSYTHLHPHLKPPAPDPVCTARRNGIRCKRYTDVYKRQALRFMQKCTAYPTVKLLMNWTGKPKPIRFPIPKCGLNR